MRHQGLTRRVRPSQHPSIHFPKSLKNLRQWDGSAAPCLCDYSRHWSGVNHELEQERTRQIRDEQSPMVEQVPPLLPTSRDRREDSGFWVEPRGDDSKTAASWGAWRG